MARLVGGGPHVGVRLGVVVEPRQRLGERPAERRHRSTRARRSATCLTSPSRFVPVGTIGRRMSYSESPSSFHSSASRATLQVAVQVGPSNLLRARCELDTPAGDRNAVMGERIDINGHPTWIDDRGSGDETVLLLHGGMSHSDVLAGVLAEPLLERYRVVAFDRKAHGYTADAGGPFHYADMAGDTIDVLEQVVGGAAHLVGWSDGGSLPCSSPCADPISSAASSPSVPTTTLTDCSRSRSTRTPGRRDHDAGVRRAVTGRSRALRRAVRTDVDHGDDRAHADGERTGDDHRTDADHGRRRRHGPPRPHVRAATKRCLRANWRSCPERRTSCPSNAPPRSPGSSWTSLLRTSRRRPSCRSAEPADVLTRPGLVVIGFVVTTIVTTIALVLVAVVANGCGRAGRRGE